MKNLNTLLALIFFSLFSFHSNAQVKTGADYFAGKWHALIPGTPLGDLNRFYILEKTGDSLSGHVQDGVTGTEITKCSKVEVSGDQITILLYCQWVRC